MSEQLKYPYLPPFDNEVKFYEGSQARVNPKGVEKQAKTCPKCQFPIHVRVFMKPCFHYMCYDCYSNNKYECAFCNRIICEIVRLGDRQEMLSCDGKCYQVFECEQELKEHQMYHQLGEIQQKNLLIQQKNQ